MVLNFGYCLIAALLTHWSLVTAIQSPTCLKNTFPMTSGGSRDEVANCLVYD